MVERLERVNQRMELHQRYVDDTNVVAMQTVVGARYDGDNLVITEESKREDENVPADERTMRFIQSVASHIHPSIRLTIDYGNRHANGKVPIVGRTNVDSGGGRGQKDSIRKL